MQVPHHVFWISGKLWNFCRLKTGSGIDVSTTLVHARSSSGAGLQCPKLWRSWPWGTTFARANRGPAWSKILRSTTESEKRSSMSTSIRVGSHPSSDFKKRKYPLCCIAPFDRQPSAPHPRPIGRSGDSYSAGALHRVVRQAPIDPLACCCNIG